jgi:predicted transcriptional regulator
MASAKESVQQTLDHLPDQASWDEIMYELYVKQKIEAGLKAFEEGRTIPHEEMKRRLLAKKRQT